MQSGTFRSGERQNGAVWHIDGAKAAFAPLFYQALHLLIATQNRWQRFDRENQKLRTKMEEVRIVARAKCILVEYLRMSEQQAHRYIEKQAMDMRTSKKDVAENILKTYT